MKKICFAFNHLQYSDGVARSIIAIANYLSNNEYEVTLKPIFKIEKGCLGLLNRNIKVKSVFGFYFNGLSKIINKLPDTILHYLIFGNDNFDIEVGFQYGISTRAVVSKNNKAKRLIWMHTYDEELVFKNYYVKADKLICVSKCNVERLKNELSKNMVIDYCYNPIDERKVISLGQEEIEIKKNEKITFVSVGRLSEEKGYLRLLDVVYKLRKQGFEFNLWLIGDGPQRKELEEKVKSLNLGESVIFLGNQSNPHKYTSKSDVFICSSFREGYSTACTESIMLNIPVITTDVSGAKEIIEDAECGRLVANSIDGIYFGMKEVLEKPEIIDEWKNILQRTKVHFYSKKRLERLEKILS